MSTRLDELKQAAGRLSVAERAELVLSLIESLDETADEDVEAAWVLEAKHRAEQIDRGEVHPVPGDEVMAQLRRKLE